MGPVGGAGHGSGSRGLEISSSGGRRPQLKRMSSGITRALLAQEMPDVENLPSEKKELTAQLFKAGHMQRTFLQQNFAQWGALTEGQMKVTINALNREHYGMVLVDTGAWFKKSEEEMKEKLG